MTRRGDLAPYYSADMTTPDDRERACGLWERWEVLCRRVDADPDAAKRWRDDLRVRHAEPHRYYHTADHLVAVLDALEVIDANEVASEFATFFHDAIYDPRAVDNELRSAELARVALGELCATVDADLVSGCIEATAGHQRDADTGCDSSAFSSVVSAFLDADLSILGAPRSVYDAYARSIRAEYAHVPERAYREGRSAVLADFASRPKIFSTDRAIERWETQARLNLERELVELASSSAPE